MSDVADSALPAADVFAGDVLAARARLGTAVRQTPCVHSTTLSGLLGCTVYLKLENLQFTASFKERGALNKLLQLSEADQQRGVICMSAGNHAQAVAYHARRLGIRSTIVMPRFTRNAKVEHTREFADEVLLHGTTLDEARALAEQLATARDLVLVHPYDDAAVIAGQGTMTAEILEQVPGLDVLIVPVGGGGLIAGAALALQAANNAAQLVGVQTQRYPFAHHAWQHSESPEPVPLGTLAEGIAVKRPGIRTLAIMRERVNSMLLVDETDIEDAIALLLDVEKTVAEGAGAAALAALRRHGNRWRGKCVVVVVSGGNVDLIDLSSVIQRHLVRSARLVRMRIELPDVPGALAEVARVLGEMDSNIIEINHNRDFAASSVRSVVVEFVLQMRGEEQADQVLTGLRVRGYAAYTLERLGDDSG